MKIRTQCRECGLPFRARLAAADRLLACPACEAQRPVDPTLIVAADRVEGCALCGSEHLYRQRDFNRAWGCALVALGAALVPWTYGLSLIALSLVDWWLYRRLAESVVCYRCDTVYRDARPTPRQGEFDLLKHDVVKYGKSWQQVEKEEAG